MKLWAKRLGAAALILVGGILFFNHIGKLLDWPHLYPDLGKLHLTNLIFLGLALLTFAFAWISAAYLLLNAEQKLLLLLIPAAALFALLNVSALCLTQAVGDIPCSYTTSLEVCREEFRSDVFHVDDLDLYPRFAQGEVTAYARYEWEDVLSESITRTYDQDAFMVESRRLEQLRLDKFAPSQKPAAKETVCYNLTQGETLWQVLVEPKTKSVTYSRFLKQDQLPSFAPKPTEKPENPAS